MNANRIALSAGTGLLIPLLIVACDFDPASPAQSHPALNVGSAAACVAKKSLTERLDFASVDRASKHLGRPTAWARQLSAFDRGARQRTLEPTSTQGFLAFASNAAVAWAPDEQAYWSGLADRLSDAVAGLNLKVPQILLLKTTGEEEFSAAYARDRAIILPQDRVALARDERRDFFLLAHELFHVLSGENPRQRHALNVLLGFERFAKFAYPAELEERRLSNPDAYFADYALTVETASGAADVVAVIQSAVPLEEVIELPTGGPPAIFGVLDIVLLPVDTRTGAVLRDGSGNLIKYSFGNTNWVPQMLRNSSNIIHPEELLADNFATLMEWRANGSLAPANPSGFPANDLALLTAIEEALTAGCAG